MKKLIYHFILLFVLNQIAFSNNFEITPLIISFSGVEANGDTIIAYGDYGSMLISYDNAVNWKQVNVFEKGTIIKLDWSDIKMVALNNIGEIAVSNDKGINWSTIANLNDSVLSVIKYPDGYFFRAKNKLFTITNDYKYKNEYLLYSNDYEKFNLYEQQQYKSSIAYFKNNLIAVIDSSCLLRFDYNLKIIDTLSFNKSGIFDSTYQYVSGYRLATDSIYLYIEVIGNHIIDSINNIEDTLYKTKDFKNLEKYLKLSSTTNSLFKVINDKFYTINKNDKYLIDTIKLSTRDYNQYISDFTVVNNKLINVGKYKIIETIDLNDSNLHVISDCSACSSVIAPEKIGDSSYLFFSGSFWDYYNLPYIYRTDNNGITFYPVVKNDKGISDDKRFSKHQIVFKYFDENEKKIYLGGMIFFDYQADLFVTDDYCNTFIYKPINDLIIHKIGQTIDNYNNAFSIPNLQRNNDNFIIVGGYNKYQKVIRDNIITLNKNFEIISELFTRDMVIDYVHSKDTNTFLIHCANAIDWTSEIRYTSDKGINWETIKKYPITDTLVYRKEIDYNNIKLLALIHQNRTEQYIRLDVLNLDNNKLDSIYEWRNYYNQLNWSQDGVGIESDSGIVYITFLDTLFYTIDIFNRSRWHFQILPDKGRIFCRPIKKFGDKFFVNYKVDNFTSGKDIFWFKPLDPITKVDDIRIEDVDYLYAFPPYPMPGYNQISFHLYWDLCDDIDNDEINVYSILGAKVAGREKFTINKASLYDGYLTWDCSDIKAGPYFIQIKRGNYSKTVKVIVAR